MGFQLEDYKDWKLPGASILYEGEKCYKQYFITNPRRLGKGAFWKLFRRRSPLLDG